MAGRAAAKIRAFFDEGTNTVSYLVADPATMRAAVIDPVLDFDLPSGEADVRSAQAMLAAAKAEGLTIEWVLETHAHADHLSAAPFIKAETGAQSVIRDATELVAQVPAWLQADHDALTAKVLRKPERAEIAAPVQEQLIVELYSK